MQPAAAPLFYDAMLHGQPVRVVAAWMALRRRPGAATVLVQVAETLNKRNRLAWEILASVVVPQLLLILLAGAVVYFGVSRGLLPLQAAAVAPSRTARTWT